MPPGKIAYGTGFIISSQYIYFGGFQEQEGLTKCRIVLVLDYLLTMAWEHIISCYFINSFVRVESDIVVSF